MVADRRQLAAHPAFRYTIQREPDTEPFLVNAVKKIVKVKFLLPVFMPITGFSSVSFRVC